MNRRLRLLTGLLAGGLLLTPATALAAEQHPAPEHGTGSSPAHPPIHETAPPAPPASGDGTRPSPTHPPAHETAPPTPPSPEHPAPEPHEGMEQHRARCLSAVDERLNALGRAASHLSDAPHLTSGHRITLAAQLAEVSAGLQAVSDRISSASDPVALRQDCALVVRDYPVGAFYLPRTRLVAAADAAVQAATRLDDVADRLEAAVEAASLRGDDVTAAKADLQSMRDEIAAARASAAGVPESILRLTGADWNADHRVLHPALVALHSVRQDLHDAHALARQVTVDLHS